MESDLGKLFIGGISWDSDEDQLKDYFGAYGEVAEAVIMRDRTTGRARGFGFVVFADPAVAERVVIQKHMIDGRTVEVNKAVPRDDHRIIDRNNNSNNGSPVPGPGRTKKIFVGGIASTVTESDFKLYFDQFGTIMDVVVMYDHNTQRPRGFGFITYDTEEAVDRVLQKTFHELNGKMVEVKRAVPKELSPGPTRSPLVGYRSASGYRSGNIGYIGGDNNYRFGATGLGRDIGPGLAATSPFVASTGDYERSYADLNSANSRFVDAPWQSKSSEYNGSSSFGYGLDTAAESMVKSSEGYVGSYSIANRQASRGIAA